MNNYEHKHLQDTLQYSHPPNSWDNKLKYKHSHLKNSKHKSLMHSMEHTSKAWQEDYLNREHCCHHLYNS